MSAALYNLTLRISSQFQTYPTTETNPIAEMLYFIKDRND